MDFELTEEQKMFRQMAREFAERELISAGKEYDQSGKYPYEFFEKMAPLGLLGVLIPQKYDGHAAPGQLLINQNPSERPESQSTVFLGDEYTQ